MPGLQIGELASATMAYRGLEEVPNVDGVCSARLKSLRRVPQVAAPLHRTGRSLRAAVWCGTSTASEPAAAAEPGYCALMPASRITPAHFAASALSWAAHSSAEFPIGS